MGELYDMDLKGRPLAYTPFCDNNKEMDGYRFWRQVRSMRNDLLNDFLFAEMFSTFIHQFVFHCRRVSGRTICGESLIISGTVQLCIYILSVFAKSTLILFILLIDLWSSHGTICICVVLVCEQWTFLILFIISNWFIMFPQCFVCRWFDEIPPNCSWRYTKGLLWNS